MDKVGRRPLLPRNFISIACGLSDDTSAQRPDQNKSAYAQSEFVALIMEKRKIYHEKAKREYVVDRVYESLPKELKECAKCHWAMPLSEFNTSKITADKLYTWCKLCAKEYRQQYHEINKERENRKNKEWRNNNKKKVSGLARTRRLRMYGLTNREYDELLKSQNGKCAICGVPQLESNWSFCVDHNHKTDKIRGLLCFNCNTMLGKVGDSVSILISAVEYLERNQGDNNAAN